MDKQQNNILINNNKEGITIHFGFTKDENEEDGDVIEETNED